MPAHDEDVGEVAGPRVVLEVGRPHNRQPVIQVQPLAQVRPALLVGNHKRDCQSTWPSSSLAAGSEAATQQGSSGAGSHAGEPQEKTANAFKTHNRSL